MKIFIAVVRKESRTNINDEPNLQECYLQSQQFLGSLSRNKFIEMFCKVIMIYFDKPWVSICCLGLSALMEKGPLKLSTGFQFLGPHDDLFQQPGIEEIYVHFSMLWGAQRPLTERHFSVSTLHSNITIVHQMLTPLMNYC